MGYTGHLQILETLRLTPLVLGWQNSKIRRLFSRLRHDFPDALFTVAGFGTRTDFPPWIEDKRTMGFTEDSERKMCQLYADSRLVIGAHGSNMLLPSAHAGMTLDLMPDGRWGNLAQDVLYQQGELFLHDERIVSWRYRYVPLSLSVRAVNAIAKSMLMKFPRAVAFFEASS